MYIFIVLLQVLGHGYVKCESLSPMQILDSEQDQHLRMDEQAKQASDSLEGKCHEQTNDDDIINDDAEPNILEQSQVSLNIFDNLLKI